ncbi:Bacteriocin [Streptococcus pluranimalium]|uniref:bacteriocin n=1 Tax=Streptococcus pluranimalium TaxID=82348 RepID=UPI0039ECB22B
MEEIKKFSKISDEELQNIEGGSILGATIGGVALWKIVGGAGLVGAGIGVGYLVNK